MVADERIFAPWPAPDTTKPPSEWLEEIRGYVERCLDDEIGWYKRHIGGTRTASRSLRAAAIVLTTVGGVIPVLHSAGLLPAKWDLLPDLDLGQLGYVFLAVAGGFALFDRFFGFSTAWMRYVAAMIELEKLRESFRLDWLILVRGLEESGDEGPRRLLASAKRTVLKAKELTERETDAWISEFKTNLAHLEKDLRERAEASRPGAIDLRVKDAAQATNGFEIRLDQMVVEKATGPSASIGHVTPGLHKVSVATELDGKAYRASRMVEVRPAEVVQVELELGIR